MTRGDRLLIGLIALAILLSVPVSAGAFGREAGAASVCSPFGSTTLDLAKNGEYKVEGRLGPVVLQVADGTVRCVAADCPDEVCVHSGPAAMGRPIVCAPNGVCVSLTASDRDGGIDAVSR